MKGLSTKERPQEEKNVAHYAGPLDGLNVGRAMSVRV